MTHGNDLAVDTIEPETMSTQAHDRRHPSTKKPTKKEVRRGAIKATKLAVIEPSRAEQKPFPWVESKGKMALVAIAAATLGGLATLAAVRVGRWLT